MAGLGNESSSEKTVLCLLRQVGGQREREAREGLWDHLVGYCVRGCWARWSFLDVFQQASSNEKQYPIALTFMLSSDFHG